VATEAQPQPEIRVAGVKPYVASVVSSKEGVPQQILSDVSPTEQTGINAGLFNRPPGMLPGHQRESQANVMPDWMREGLARGGTMRAVDMQQYADQNIPTTADSTGGQPRSTGATGRDPVPAPKRDNAV